MANTIQIKRGANASLPTLAEGELGFSTDTKQVHIGDGSANHEVLMHNKFDAGTLLYAESDNTPVAKTRAELLALLSGQLGADFSANAHKITNILDPTGDQDAATKSYVDAVATGLDIKGSCDVATAEAMPANTASGSGVGKTLTMDAVGVLTIDGVATVLNDRILVKDEVTGANNGIYKVTTEGTESVAAVLTRDTDFDEDAEVTAGAFTFIEKGTTNADTGWVLTTNDPITVDTTALSFGQFSGAGTITAGDGLTKTGSTLDVGAGTGIQVNADSVEVLYGSTATTACVGNDSRLSDARAPTAHATGHVTGGSDVIADAVASGNSGLLSGTDKAKLDGIEASAKDDQTAAEIVTLINASAEVIADANIASTIARDSEVATAVSDHAALTTGIHGAGANTLLHSASVIDGGAFA